MAARNDFLRKALTCLHCLKHNRLRMNLLKSVRYFSRTSIATGSKPGGSVERNVSNVYDVAIVGGGVLGSSSAYFLANRMKHGMGRVCVIERDPSYSKASTTLSVASIRQQFSIAENIQMSQQSFQFLEEIEQHLSVDGCDPPDIQLFKSGYLFLASKTGEETLKKNHALQRNLGCHVTLLSPSELSKKFPWLNTDGIELASLGTGSEGWFDPWSLLNTFKRKAISLGVDYITGDAVDFVTDQNGQINSIKVATPDNLQTIHCGVMVNAAGPNAGHLAEKLGVHLPVEPRKRFVFVVDCPDAPGRDEMPFVVDGTGTYVRPEGGCFITGMSPPEEDDRESFDFDVDYDFFNEKVWEILAHRIPAFECLKVQSAWAGHYDYNTLDQNAIIGRHPQIRNLIFVNGFSGHGIQQSPAAGRAVSELILDSGFQTIDLTALGYERVLSNEPMREKNIV